jgi:urease accessory protein
MGQAKCKEGIATLRVGRVHGASAVLVSRSRSPLCLLTPRPRGPSVWAYTSNLGGGMVAGDTSKIEITIDPGALCYLGTQASSKIYRNPLNRPCEHRLDATVAAGATLVFAPDAVQCFADAVYHQRQTFHLASDANLVLVDWISAGRLARGERWVFKRYSSRNEVYVEGRPVVIDAIDLDASSGLSRFQTGRFNCLGFVLLLGPALISRSKEILDKVAALPIEPGAGLMSAASPIGNGIILRLAGLSVEQVGLAIYEHLKFMKDLLHDDPWSRKW